MGWQRPVALELLNDLDAVVQVDLVSVVAHCAALAAQVGGNHLDGQRQAVQPLADDARGSLLALVLRWEVVGQQRHRIRKR